MNSVRQTQITVVKALAAVIAVLGILGFVFLKEPVPFMMGLIFGSAISALNFFQLANTLNRAVKMHPGKAQTFAVTQYFIRYVITAIVIYISIVAPYINIIGTVMGLLTIKLIIFATNLFNDKTYYKNIFKRKEDEPNGR
ncbi:MAG: ATP synthase subunit I [Clostridia bacterium]|nr:ATP synthase subunit I [Clostridia bacterium]